MNTIPSFYSNQFQIMGGHKITRTQKHANACMTRFTEQGNHFFSFISKFKSLSKKDYTIYRETTSYIRISLMQWLKSIHIFMIS